MKKVRSSGGDAGAADGQAINAERGLADADRNALAILAAGAHTGIKFEIIPHHADPGQHGGE